MKRVYRYVYFVASTLRLVSYGRWKRDGQPNPFLRNATSRPQTDRNEVTAAFHDHLVDRPAQTLYGPTSRKIDDPTK